jgi:hypothetical protein
VRAIDLPRNLNELHEMLATRTTRRSGWIGATAWWAILMLVLYTAGVLGAGATPLASISFVEPDGDNDYVGEGSDFATRVWSNPWSFNAVYDLARPFHLSGFGSAGGTLSGQVAGNDPHFFLLFPGVPSAINLNTGQQHPINADEYQRVAFRFCTGATHANQAIRLFWYDAYTSGSVYYSGLIYVGSGCNVYLYDLSARADWQGTVTGLRFDLENFQSGDAFSLDWFRLTRDPDWSNSYAIQWQDLSPTNGSLQLHLDNDASGFDGVLIATRSNAPGTGSLSWGSSDQGLPLPQDFQPGEYYVYAKVNGQTAGYSLAPLVVSQAPILRFTNPSFTSGRDYATDHGNPWDMDSSGTDGDVERCPSYTFSGGEVVATCTGPDPSFLFNVPTPIETSYYRYFTIEWYSQYSFYDGISGGVSRLYWLNNYSYPTATEDLIINVPAQWRTYSLDLSHVPIEDYGAANPWGSEHWRVLRFDPNENQPGVLWQWRIRDARLTGPPEADGFFAITWDLDNPEDEAVILTLYYDHDNHGLDGVQIDPAGAAATATWPIPLPRGTTLPEDQNVIYLPSVTKNACWGPCQGWNTTGIPSGEYFIYGCLDDGVNQICRYSDVPVLIR